jgi:N6-adenosine-specific RNA methylase IME4
MKLPEGKFGLIMADPPWTFKAWSDKGLGKSPQQHYDCLDVDDIAHLPVNGVCMPDCLLWLWCTWPMLNEGLSVLQHWGFKYSTGGAWHKKTKHGKTQFGTGHRLRSACEPFLIGTCGKPKTTRGTRNLVEGLVREHSRKPDEAYAAAEALMPNVARLDLFSREPRPGWTSWGAEAHKFDAKPVPGRCPDTLDMFPEASNGARVE